MASWENDSKAGKLTKRLNNLMRIAKGAEANIMHALSLLEQELPLESAQGTKVIARKCLLKQDLESVQWHVRRIKSFCDELKQHNPEYQPRHVAAKKRKGK